MSFGQSLFCVVLAILVGIMLGAIAYAWRQAEWLADCKSAGGVPVAQACIRKDVVLEVK